MSEPEARGPEEHDKTAPLEWRVPGVCARLDGSAAALGEQSVPTPKRMMHLGAFVHETGQHVAAWRHPGAHARTGASFAAMVETARLAERGKMDFLFLADSAAVSTAGSADQRGRMGKVVKFEPMTILSALAAVTRNLGLVATSTTTYNEPYTCLLYTSPSPRDS